MMEDFLRRLIVAAIESFPIDEKQKAAILEKIQSSRPDEDG